MFRNREDAALKLAERLKHRAWHNPVVLGVPRGGVVIGAVLAQELGANLDVILARKLPAPGQPELALGAIGEDGEVYLDSLAMAWFADVEEYIAAETQRQMAEIVRRQEQFRGGRPPMPVAGRSVIVTDDGIATGSTMIAALQVLKAKQPYQVVVAVPVGARSAWARSRQHCDELICLLAPSSFRAVGQFYANFTQVEDDQVLALLREAQSGERR